jgi:pilus assembly protein Flp/PilA
VQCEGFDVQVSVRLRADLEAGDGYFFNEEEASIMKLVQTFKNFVREEDGVTAIEYGLIAALIAVVIIGAVTAVGTNLKAVFQFVADNLTT